MRFCSQPSIDIFTSYFGQAGSSMLLQKLKIDDPVDASPVHGFCGIWGVLACGFFDWGNGLVTWYRL